MRPVKFDPELEEAYHTLFVPFKVISTQRYSLKNVYNNTNEKESKGYLC